MGERGCGGALTPSQQSVKTVSCGTECSVRLHVSHIMHRQTEEAVVVRGKHREEERKLPAAMHNKAETKSLAPEVKA